MTKKVWLVVVILMASFLFFGCSHEPGNVSNPNGIQLVGKAPGGEIRYNLDCGRKVVNVTWQDGTYKPWILTRPMREGETPETYTWVEYESEGHAVKMYKFVECSEKR